LEEFAFDFIKESTPAYFSSADLKMNDFFAGFGAMKKSIVFGSDKFGND